MAPPSDPSLMQAAARGDWEAFEQLVERHQTTVWRTAYRLLADAHAAEDIAQEAFLRVFLARQRYRPSATFHAYLMRIVVRLCLDYLRKSRPIPADVLVNPADTSPSPTRQAEQRERAQAVERTLAQLPPKQRTAVVLRYYEGLSVRDIAEIMATTEKAVERLLARGRAAMYERLERHLP